MDARTPTGYGRYPQRGCRAMPPQQIAANPQTRVPAQAPPVNRAPAANRAAASALSRPQAQNPAAQPQPSTSVPLQPAHPQPFKRAHLSGYAKDFCLVVEKGAMLPLPLETQRSESWMGIKGGVTEVPEDGYYMVLWELGVSGVNGESTLQLKINETASQLTYALHPGYDSGQQVTWLNKGDKLGLFLQAGEGKAEAVCGSAQFTVIRLG